MHPALGGRAHMERNIRCLWSWQEAVKHITFIITEYSVLSLKSFQSHIKGRTVQVQTDNTTMMICLNKPAATGSHPLSVRAGHMETDHPEKDNIGSCPPTTTPKYLGRLSRKLMPHTNRS